MSENRAFNRATRPGVHARISTATTATPSPIRGEKSAKLSPTSATSSKSSSGTSLYTASGPGVELCMPNKPTSFVVRATSDQRQLRAADLRVLIKGPTNVKHTVTERPDGALDVAYTPPMSGEYRITVSVGASQASGSPFRVPCQLPRACEICSETDLNGGYGFAGEVYTARLVCKDQYRNPYTGRVDVVANVMDGNEILSEAQVTEVRPGEFDISFYPEISATYGLAIVLDGTRPLSGSPFKIRVKSDETIPSKCKVYGAQLVHGVAGQPMKFHIQAMDAKNNARLVGGDPFAVEITGPGEPRPTATVRDNGNGTYDVTWCTEKAGVYLVSTTMDGSMVGKGPVSCTVSAAKLQGSNSFCTGQGVKRAQAGQVAEFKITAVDGFGNTRSTGGDVFHVHIHSAGSSGKGAPQTALVEDNGDGTYRAKYTINVTGQYDIHVRYADTNEPVKGSPFLIPVEAGSIDPRCSRIYGPGLQAVQLGRASTILVEMADKWGNKVYASGGFNPSCIHMDVRGPGAVTVTPGALQDGVQTYCYVAKQPGTYTISATVDGQHLGDSPATVTASTSEACAAMCEVRGAPLDLVTTAGRAADVYIIAKDAKGIQKSLGGDVFHVTWQHMGSGEGQVTNGKVEDLGTGEYRSRFVATHAGYYHVAVTNNNSSIAGSPFTACVQAAGIEPAACVASGAGLVSAKAGSKTSFAIKPKDTYANPVPVDDVRHFHAAIQGPADVDVHLTASDDHTEVMATYTATAAGTYTVAATYKGQHIQGSTWALQVAPDLGRALHSRYVQLPDSFTAGNSVNMALAVNDVHGNASLGGDRVVLEADNAVEGVTSLTVVDDGHGVYRAAYAPTRSGFVTIRAFVNGELIGVPHTLPVLPAGLRALVPVTPGLWTCTAGDKGVFLVRGKDEFGNLLTQGGAHIVATVHSHTTDNTNNTSKNNTSKNNTNGNNKPNTADWSASVTDQGDGTYAVVCTVTQAGPFKVSVAAAEHPSVGVTMTGMCVPGRVCASKCQLLQADHDIVAGTEGTVHIVRCDGYGNRLAETTSAAPISATSTGPDTLHVHVLEQADGSVKLQYTARTAGDYTLRCTSSVSGEAFCNSPWTITVRAGEVLPENCQATLVTVDGQHRSVAGQTVTVAVMFRDRYGNAVQGTEKGVPLEVWAEGPENVAFAVDGASGKCGAKLTKSGSYLVHAAINGTAVSGWPQLLHVLADKSDPVRSYVSGAPPEGLRVGEPVTLLLHTVDAYGNARGQGGEEVVVELHGPLGSQVREAWVVDNENGTYAARFKPDMPGSWTIKPRIGRKFVHGEGGYELLADTGTLSAMEYSLRGQPEKPMAAGSVTPMAVIPEMPGAQVSGTEVFTAVLTAPGGTSEHLDVHVLDDRSGFRLKAAWMLAGQYSVRVLLDGVDIVGSPSLVEVVPGGLCLATSLMQGSALRSCKAGESAHFSIRGRDAVGNPIATGGATIATTVTDAAGHVMIDAMRDNGDGSYDGNVMLTTAGPYTIKVALGGPQQKEAEGASARAVVFRGVCHPGACDAGACVVQQKPGVLVAGGVGMLRIACKDTHGNLIKFMHNTIPLVAHGDDNLHVTLHEASEGILVARYQCTTVGTYRMSVIEPTSGQPIPASPLTVEVHAAAPSPLHTRVRLPEGPLVGEPLVATVQYRDAYGNGTTVPEGGVGLVEVHAAGPAPLEMVAQEGKGLVGTPSVAGVYTLVATMQGVTLPGWPMSITVQASHALHVRLQGHTLTAGLTCGQPCPITVLLYDSHGNRKTTPGDRVDLLVVPLEGPAVPVPAADMGAGVYVATVTAASAGSYTLLPRVHGKEVRAAAKEVKAMWPPLVAMDCVAMVNVDQPTCGQAMTVTVQPKHVASGRRFSGAEAVTVSMATPSGKTIALPAKMLDDTTYTVDVPLQHAGTHSVAVSMGGEAVQGSPLHVHATPGPLSLERSRLEGPRVCAAGVPSTLRLVAADAFGNAIAHGGAQLRAVACGVDDMGSGDPASVVDNDDGTYAVSFVHTRPGGLVLTLSIQGSRAGMLRVPCTCVAGGPVGARSSVVGYDTDVEAGRVGVLTLQLADGYGNPLKQDAVGVPVTAQVVQGGPLLMLKTQPQGDGTVLVSYCGAVAGRCMIELLVGGEDAGEEGRVPGEHVVVVRSGPVCPSRCKAAFELQSTDTSSTTAQAGQHVPIIVTLLDALGNILSSEETDAVDIRVDAVFPLSMPFSSMGGGRFGATLERACTYLVSVKVNGQEINEWPRQLHIAPGPAAPDMCTLSGNAQVRGVVVGRVARMLLQARDAYGNTRTIGGDAVGVVAALGRGEDKGTKGVVVDNGDGTYRLEVAVASPGRWTITPTVHGQPCGPAVWAIEAEYGALQPEEMMVVHGNAIKGVCGTSDVIMVKPIASDRRVSGSEHLTASVTGTSNTKAPLPVRLLDSREGFAMQVTWRQAGQHLVNVYLDGVHVQGSPLQLHAQPGALAPKACTVVDYRNAGGTLDLTVQGRDLLNNLCPLKGAPVELVADPPECLALATPQWAADGCTVRLTAAVQAKGRFNVAVDGRSLFATGRVLQYEKGGSHAAETKLRPLNEGALVHAVAGVQASLLVVLANGSGLPVLQGVLKDPHPGKVVEGSSVVVKPRDDGLFEVLVCVSRVGEYVLHVSMENMPSVACTARIHVAPGPPSAAHTAVRMLDAQPVAGAPCRIALQRMDAQGNPVVCPNTQGVFVGHVTGPGPAMLEWSEQGDGVALCTLRARTAGTYALQLSMAATGDVVAGSPLQVEMAPGALSGSASSFSVAGFTGKMASTIVAGQGLVVVLEAKDGFGNAAVCCEQQVQAAAHGPQGIVPLVYTQQQQGAPVLTADVHVAGRYHIQVSLLDPTTNQWHKIQADELRATLLVTPAALSHAHTTFSHVASTLHAGTPAMLYIQPTDKYGNKGASGGSFIVQLYDGKNAIPCAVTSSMETGGALVAKVLSTRTGVFKLRVIVAKDGQKVLLHTSDVRVEEAAAAAGKSFILGHWPPSGPVANIAAGFVIQACDEYGNSLTKGGARYLVDIVGLPAQAITVTDRGDGQYNVQYIVPGEGTYRVNVTLDGKQVQGSPSSITAFRDVVGLANSEMEKKMATTITHLRRNVAEARTNYRLLKAEAASLEQFIPVMVEGARSGIYEALKHHDALLAETRQAYQREAAERRRLHNMVQELRGNIRVYIRVKPLSQDERQAGIQAVLRCMDDSRVVCNANTGVPKMFDFDRTFGPDTSQEVVFEDVAQLVTSALDGYNVCIFAYGQTGAGKTYTMEGTQNNPGINYRTIAELFRSIREEHTADEKHTITASIVEIYNEVVHDLLAEEGKKECDLQRTTTGFDVVGLTETEVTSPEQIFEIMAYGFQHRATGCHDINAHSSRSHCLLIINVRAENRSTGIVTRGKLTLCDLAGSERINKTHATGLTLTEAQNINRSLLELGNVISALMQQAQHVPYRNSKLTMLLQDSLGGDSKALMFCNVSPASVHATESLSSLAFASKVSNVVLKTPQKKFEEAGPQGAAAALAAAATKSKLHAAADVVIGGGGGGGGRRQGSSIPMPFARD